MKENEAIKMIQYRIDTASEIIGKGEDSNAFEDLEIAIKALEKQIPMKPKLSRVDNETIYCRCPMCKLTTVLYDDCVMRYCKECGQKLDWE